MTEIISYDERQGVPSASRLLRLKLCPGSYWAEKKYLGNQQNKSNSDAERGRRIHDAVKAIAMDENLSKFYPGINANEIEEAWRLWGIYKKIENQVFSDANDNQQRVIEERFWLLDDEKIRVLTGQIDIGAIYFNEREQIWEALICDYKTGWGDVDEADSNLQMRAYAVLLKANRPDLRRIIVAIIAPNQGKPTLTCYKERDLELAKYEVLEILQEATLRDAPRIGGVEQCKYCSVKTKCPEYRREFLAPVPMVRDFTLTAQDWTPEMRIRFCEVLPEIKKWVEDRTTEIKELTKQGEVPGWQVGRGKKIQRLKDPQEAYRRVSKLLSADQFTEACSVSLPKLRKVYAKAWEVTETESKYHLAEKLAGLIEETETEGILEKIK